MELTLNRGAIITGTQLKETDTHYQVCVETVNYKKGALALGASEWQPGEKVFIPKKDISKIN